MYKLLKYIFPVLKNAILSGQLFKEKAELVPPIEDIHADWDVPVSDGSTILVNRFKSKKALAEKRALPVIMCAHPYDNHLVACLLRNLPTFANV